MDWYNLLLGIIFFLVGVIIILLKFRDTNGSKTWLTYGNVNFTFAGILAIIFGLYYIISAI